MIGCEIKIIYKWDVYVIFILTGAIAVLSEFMKKDMTRIRNKSAFVNGIIDRVQKELAHDKVCLLLCVRVYVCVRACVRVRACVHFICILWCAPNAGWDCLFSCCTSLLASTLSLPSPASVLYVAHCVTRYHANTLPLSPPHPRSSSPRPLHLARPHPLAPNCAYA